MLTPEQQSRVCAAARSYLGVRWRGQGRDHQGVDCVGIAERSFIDAGLPLRAPPATYRNVDSKLLMQTVHEHFDRVPRSRAQAADLVIYGVPWEAHVAILVDGDPLNAIHCPAGGHVVEARFDPGRGDIRGVYRWR